MNFPANLEYCAFQTFPRACRDWSKDNSLSLNDSPASRVLDRHFFLAWPTRFGNAFWMCCVLNPLHLIFREKSISASTFRNCSLTGALTLARKVQAGRNSRLLIWVLCVLITKFLLNQITAACCSFGSFRQLFSSAAFASYLRSAQGFFG